MIVARPQDLVHQIPVVGEEDEALGVLVEAPYGEDAGAVVDEVDYVVLLPASVVETMPTGLFSTMKTRLSASRASIT